MRLHDQEGETVRAPDHLNEALEALQDRAAVRDAPSGERSMARAVAGFNAIFGQSLTEEQGWQFMAILKIVRGAQGEYRADDYTDEAAYAALAGEAACKHRRAQKPMYVDSNPVCAGGMVKRVEGGPYRSVMDHE